MAREVSTVNTEQDELPDKLLVGKTSEQILGQHGLIKQMIQRMVELALAAGLTAHPGCGPHERAESTRDNARNGSGTKTVLTDTGALPIEVPCDRAGTFTNPQRQGRKNSEGAKKKPLARGASSYWALFRIQPDRACCDGLCFAPPILRTRNDYQVNFSRNLWLGTRHYSSTLTVHCQ